MWCLNFCFLFLFPLFVNSLPLHENSNVESIIVDVDPGADDAIALLMLLARRKDVNIEAVTCVQGNTGVNNATINALNTLAVVGRFDIPVYSGSPSGLVYSVTSDFYFGQDGFGDFVSKTPANMNQLRKGHAAAELAHRVSEKPGKITIVALGPLTNLALAQHLNPKFTEQAAKIFIMGGSYKGGGTVGPGIEYNIYGDPDAAAFLFPRISPKTPTVLLPFEVCTDSEIPMAWRLNTLGKLGSKKVSFINNAERMILKGEKWLTCDPLVAAIILEPDIVTDSFTGQPVVSTTVNRGQMNVTASEGSVEIVTSIDVEIFKRLLLTTLA